MYLNCHLSVNSSTFLSVFFPRSSQQIISSIVQLFHGFDPQRFMQKNHCQCKIITVTSSDRLKRAIIPFFGWFPNAGNQKEGKPEIGATRER